MKRGLLILLVITCALMASTAEAKRRRRRAPKKEKPAAAEQIVVGDTTEASDNGGGKATGKGKDKVFDFTGLSIEGKLRTPQLLYFLGRARQELERAALESRSFIPEMVRSIEEEGL